MIIHYFPDHRFVVYVLYIYPFKCLSEVKFQNLLENADFPNRLNSHYLYLSES